MPGTAYCRFGLAVQRPKEPGNWADERVTEFYEITCFDSPPNVAQSLSKETRLILVSKCGDRALD
jgi:hypothetical protein